MNEDFADNRGLNISRLLDTLQVKRSVNIGNKDDIYELPHELSKESTLSILRN